MITFGLGVGSFLMRMVFAARAERQRHGGSARRACCLCLGNMVK